MTRDEALAIADKARRQLPNAIKRTFTREDLASFLMSDFVSEPEVYRRDPEEADARTAERLRQWLTKRAMAS